MSYDLSKVEINENRRGTTSPFIGYGTGQVLRINSIELKYSKSSNSPKAIFHMETKPIKEDGFVPVDGALGQVGRISCGIYMKEDKAKEKFFQDLKRISIAVGVQDEFDKIKGETFEETVKKIEKVICGKDKWARYTIFAEQYMKADGKTGTTYFLPRFEFVESLDTDPSRLVQFDANNKYHYKKLHVGAETETADESDDLPF